MGKAPARGARSFLKLRRGGRRAGRAVDAKRDGFYGDLKKKFKRCPEPSRVKIAPARHKKPRAEVSLSAPGPCFAFSPPGESQTSAGRIPPGRKAEVGKRGGKGLGYPTGLGLARSCCSLPSFSPRRLIGNFHHAGCRHSLLGTAAKKGKRRKEGRASGLETCEGHKWHPRRRMLLIVSATPMLFQQQK